MKPLFADATPAHTRTTVAEPDLSGFQQVNLGNTAVVVAQPVTTRALSTHVITREMIDKLGEATASKPSQITNAILASVKASDADKFGLNLNELVAQAKKLDPAKMGKGGFLSGMLSFGGNLKEKLLAQYSTVEARMDALTVELDKMAVLMKKRAEVDCEEMYKDNEATYASLGQDIEAGKQMLADLEQQLQDLGTPTDGFGAQHVADTQAMIADVEKRVDDFGRGQQLCLLAAPQIRMQQTHDRTLAQSVRDIKVTTLPAWKGVFSRYILAMEAKKGAELVTGVYDATDAAFKMQADQLRTNTVAIATAQQRSVVSIDTLVHMQEQLLGAVDDAQRIAREGREQRALAAPKMKELEAQLISRFSPPQLIHN